MLQLLGALSPDPCSRFVPGPHWGLPQTT